MATNQETQQQLEQHNQRLREINQDIEDARQRQSDLGELYRARTRYEQKIEAIEEEIRRSKPRPGATIQVLYDNYSIVSTAVVGRQSDSALHSKQQNNDNTTPDGSHK